jgi:hypothetical protein
VSSLLRCCGTCFEWRSPDERPGSRSLELAADGYVGVSHSAVAANCSICITDIYRNSGRREEKNGTGMIS